MSIIVEIIVCAISCTMDRRAMGIDVQTGKNEVGCYGFSDIYGFAIFKNEKISGNGDFW